MLCVNSYTRGYIEESRSRMEAQLAAFRDLVTTGQGNSGGSSGSAFQAAVEAFEPLFFNNMVVVLESCFVHRSRTIEGKDGNPLNEVRMLCNSILQKQGVMAADKTIKYNPSKSVLKIQVGQEIKLSEPDFVRLRTAFLGGLEAKFV